MSINSFQNNKNRRKTLAVSMIAGVCSLALVGGTYAALSANVVTETGTESIYNELAWLYKYTETSDPIVASVTPVESPTPQTFVKVIENQSSVPAHYAIWAGGIDIADVPASILDDTRVEITISDGTNTRVVPVNLRSFLTSALVPVEDDMALVLAPRTNLTITVKITAPTDDGTKDYTDVLDFVSESFVTNVTFNQTIGGTSDLWEYASTHSTWGDETVVGVPLDGGAFGF